MNLIRQDLPRDDRTFISSMASSLGVNIRSNVDGSIVPLPLVGVLIC